MSDLSPPFSSRDLRAAFGMYPTGVAIITAITDEGERLGMTVSSFNSVSIDPPLVQFSIAKTAKALESWNAVVHFAVNILAESQSELSTRFAKALSDKWDGVDPLPAAMIGAPLIRDTLAAIECRVWARYDGGDHVILIGEVMSLSKTTNAQPRPLVFATGQYRKLDHGSAPETPFDLSHLLHGW
jgi:flavin reductase (DIM6/NTAB) family NADH-FMN oxidoreductase RutF